MQNRRDFIKQSCTMCMGAIGLGVISSQLSSCAPMPIYKGEVEKDFITVPLTSFTEKNNSVIVRSNKIDFDILLVKLENGTFNALEMKCTHQDNPLTASKTGLFCASHGSTFDLQGNVTKEPAINPLKRFKTEINNSFVTIHIKS
jgi:Rieske Fe-S protein